MNGTRVTEVPEPPRMYGAPWIQQRDSKSDGRRAREEMQPARHSQRRKLRCAELHGRVDAHHRSNRSVLFDRAAVNANRRGHAIRVLQAEAGEIAIDGLRRADSNAREEAIA